jgi:flagellar hook-associated protein 3 FlgL
MLPIANGSIARYLADLDRIQSQLQRVQAQITSGIRVNQASDDPAAAGEVLAIQAGLDRNQQLRSNLGNVKAELETADASIQTAVQLVENAITLGAQGAGTMATAQQRAILAQQVRGLQETLVGLSQASINGRYVFSGDQDTLPAYKLDLTQPEGVQRLLTAPATRIIQDASGTTLSVARTAGEIFDARNPDDTPAADNVFAALNNLRIALENNDSAGISQAQDALRKVDSRLNVEGGFYGTAQARVASADDLAQKFQVQQQAALSRVRDTDVPAAAMQLTQLQTEQQASLAVQSKASRLNLFDFLS